MTGGLKLSLSFSLNENWGFSLKEVTFLSFYSFDRGKFGGSYLISSFLSTFFILKSTIPSLPKPNRLEKRFSAKFSVYRFCWT